MRFVIPVLLVSLAAPAAAQPRAADPPRAAIAELVQLLSIPNVATDQADIQRNAERLVAMFEQRGFTAGLVKTPHSPILLGELKGPAGAARTLTFYFHYDGQPVVPAEWADSGPFQPVFRDAPLGAGGHVVSLPASGPIDPDWRLYARSASDDKGPIVAFLAALDATRAAGRPITSTIRVVIEGDEEAGSPGLGGVFRDEGARIRGDLAIIMDGPQHASGRPTFYFGARGIMSAELTVFGARQDLHSGNYGNWAPNPALALSRLLASMKDDHGHVLIQGFYDGVVPLTAGERAAIAEIPDMDAAYMRQFGFAEPERPGERLEALHDLPTLNVSGLASGTVGGQGRTIIPATATARMDLRFVKAIDPATQFARLEAHVRAQGYHLIAGDAPTDQERAAFPRLARLVRIGGYPAGRTPLSDPTARAAVAAVAATSGTTPVRLPTLGGSVPMYLFTDVLKVPTIGMPVVNYDNNQHGPNENLRLGQFFDAIRDLRAILTMPGASPRTPARSLAGPPSPRAAPRGPRRARPARHAARTR